MFYVVPYLKNFIVFTEAAFDALLSKYNKTYENEKEKDKRLKIYIRNTKKIDENNELYKNNKISYLQEENKFTDLTWSEFQDTLGLRIPLDFNNKPKSKRTSYYSYHHGEPNLAQSVNLINTGTITPVKDQSTHCGSCWAFSVVGAIEGAYFKNTGNLTELSPSDLIDCSEHTYGCNGGYPGLAFEHVFSEGIAKESDLPYIPTSKTCKKNLDRSVKISSIIYLNGSDDIMYTLDKKRVPVSALICAPPNMTPYKEGVFNDENCMEHCSASVNHAVLVVGYGTDDVGGDYWLVKNSWGDDWGEKVGG